MTREEIEKLNEVEPYCFETAREEQWYNVGLQQGLATADANPKSSWISVDADLPCNHKEFIEEVHMTEGVFNNVADCRYHIPDYWTIGEVYERLIEDCYPDEMILEGLWEVYHSWIDESISDYNTDFYYQPRDYIAACYVRGEIL